ncbi:hypothetical protein IWZ01DRAFT_44771 [Phyllosticta capitalensis]
MTEKAPAHPSAAITPACFATPKPAQSVQSEPTAMLALLTHTGRRGGGDARGKAGWLAHVCLRRHPVHPGGFSLSRHSRQRRQRSSFAKRLQAAWVARSPSSANAAEPERIMGDANVPNAARRAKPHCTRWPFLGAQQPATSCDYSDPSSRWNLDLATHLRLGYPPPLRCFLAFSPPRFATHFLLANQGRGRHRRAPTNRRPKSRQSFSFIFGSVVLVDRRRHRA